MLQSAQSMSNYHYSEFLAQPLHRGHHRLFRDGIECTGGLIKYQHRRLLIQCSGNADPLSLGAVLPFLAQRIALV